MSVRTDHQLIDDTLVTEADGIVAHCTCGWSSRPCFSSSIASIEFRNHRDGNHIEPKEAKK